LSIDGDCDKIHKEREEEGKEKYRERRIF
jgi:hypothetical protein